MTTSTFVSAPCRHGQQNSGWREKAHRAVLKNTIQIRLRLIKVSKLCRAPHRDEPYLDSLIQRATDPSRHCQGMAFVIRVFKPADDRCSGTDELGKLRLSEACRRAQCVDFAGDLFMRPCLFKILQPTRHACVDVSVGARGGKK